MNLNLNEQLLRDTKDAHICIFIANLASWLRFNIDKEKPEQRNIHNSRSWSYNTIKDLQNYFDFWSVKNIRTIIKHCQQEGLILIGNFNKHKYDKTSWYTLTDKALAYYPVLKERFDSISSITPVDTDLPETANGNVGNGNTIPEDTTTGSNNTITTSRSSNSKSKANPNELMRELIEVYREEFPNNPQPHKTLISTSLEKVLRTLIKRWPEADPKKRPIDSESFRRYMDALKRLAPKFSLGQYQTTQGNWKKNGLETFARWNTLVRFLENQYS